MFLEDLTPRIIHCRNESAVTTIPESLWLEVIQRKYKNAASNAEPGVAAAPSNLEPMLMPKIQPAEAAKENSCCHFYLKLQQFLLTDDLLAKNGFPRSGALPGTCTFAVEKPKVRLDSDKKSCVRCSKQYRWKESEFSTLQCIHHWGKNHFMWVGSRFERRYTCCRSPIGSKGCTIGDAHVHKDNTYSSSNYVQTIKKTNYYFGGCPGVYALDCEMGFTALGLELIRVSVVNFNCELIYDTLVQPEGKILDCNTRWSGITFDDLKDVKTTLKDVQFALLSIFSSDSILVGHSLECDLIALRLIHNCIIDTSVLFPHPMGPPLKRSLRNLAAYQLGIVMHISGAKGHNSTEDAAICMNLVKSKLQ